VERDCGNVVIRTIEDKFNPVPGLDGPTSNRTEVAVEAIEIRHEGITIESA
jgi:hypothetical protein